MLQLSFRLILVLTILTFSFSSAYALRDSLGIKQENGQTFILHKVEKGEGLFAISRRYDVHIDQLRKANPDALGGLVLGEIILVPWSVRRTDLDYHTIQKGETLYSISKEYDVSVAQLRELNDLKGNEIEIGQDLVIRRKQNEEDDSGTTKKSSTPKEVITHDSDVNENLTNAELDTANLTVKDTGYFKTSKENYLSEKEQKLRDEYKDEFNEQAEKYNQKISEEGRATWLDDSYISTKKCLALHRSAKQGSIIKVTNLMNNRSVYVKVVGFLDQNEDDRTLITISKTAAELIGVRDDFFRAKLEYVEPKKAK